MLIFLTILNKITGPYWNTFRKSLGQKNIDPLTITHAPGLFGHPIGIAILVFIGIFSLPSNANFYIFWFAMIAVAALVSIWTIWGLLETDFFAVQVIGSLGFVSTSIFAFLILGEVVNKVQIFSIFLAFFGVAIFSWPHRVKGKIKIDKGLVFVILAVLLSGLAAVFYKLASEYTSSYSSFLSGRFVGDLIGWSIVWIVILFFSKKNPIKDMSKCVKDRDGLFLIGAVTISTLLDSWLIYKLPISTIAIIGTLAFPSSYFISRIKYNERISAKKWAGTVFIIVAVFLFILYS